MAPWTEPFFKSIKVCLGFKPQAEKYIIQKTIPRLKKSQEKKELT